MIARSFVLVAGLAASYLTVTPQRAAAQITPVTVADKTAVTVRIAAPPLPSLHDGDAVDLVVAYPIVVGDWIAIRGGAKGRGHHVASSLVLDYVTTYNTSGTGTSLPFHLHVLC